MVALAHCPVRSRLQFEGKIVIDHLAHLAGEAPSRRPARVWSELYAELRSGAPLGDERLREIARNYGLASPRWQPASLIEMVEDPVALDFEQRYRDDAATGRCRFCCA